MKSSQTRSHSSARISRLAVPMLLVALTLVLAGCSQSAGIPSGEAEKPSADPATAVGDVAEKPSADLVIPVGDITDQAAFYPVQVDGIDLEVIAVKAPDGSIRTAFNTCQICYDSGRGYYKQSGNMLVCQNCGNRFQMSQVEVESGGCNPWPIFAKNKTVTEDSITIPYDFLKETAVIFENWKVEY